MKKFLILVFGLCILAGCGKRGKLEFPSEGYYPRQYPAPRQPKASETTTEKAPAESVLEIHDILISD